jgi:hypothetical protein
LRPVPRFPARRERRGHDVPRADEHRVRDRLRPGSGHSRGITIFGFAARISDVYSAAEPPEVAEELAAICRDAIMAFVNHAASSPASAPHASAKDSGRSKTDVLAHHGLLAAAGLKSGRPIIPATLREFLRGADQVWITNFIGNHRRCLVLYAPDEWDKYAAKLAHAESTDEDMALFKTFFSRAEPSFQSTAKGVSEFRRTFGNS